jgi:hypothetical protein
MEGRWDYLDDFKDRPYTRPSKAELFEEYLERLTHQYWFRDTLVELPHRVAFDQLIHVWKQEEAAITQSSTIHVVDAMNLLAAVHISYELSKLERIVTDLEARLDRYEHKPRRPPEEGKHRTRG